MAIANHAASPIKRYSLVRHSPCGSRHPEGAGRALIFGLTLLVAALWIEQFPLGHDTMCLPMLCMPRHPRISILWRRLWVIDSRIKMQSVVARKGALRVSRFFEIEPSRNLGLPPRDPHAFAATIGAVPDPFHRISRSRPKSDRLILQSGSVPMYRWRVRRDTALASACVIFLRG